jgi:hypothetical protein
MGDGQQHQLATCFLRYASRNTVGIQIPRSQDAPSPHQFEHAFFPRPHRLILCYEAPGHIYKARLIVTYNRDSCALPDSAAKRPLWGKENPE